MAEVQREFAARRGDLVNTDEKEGSDGTKNELDFANDEDDLTTAQPARKTTIPVTQATNRSSNVSFKQLQSICQEVLDTSASQSNELKNAVLSHLTDLNKMIMTASYHDIERFKGTGNFKSTANRTLNAFSNLTECASQTKNGQRRKAISGKGKMVAKQKSHVSVQK